MLPPKPPADPSTPPQPLTPTGRRASAAKPTTPANQKASINAGATPKTAPAAAGAGIQKKKPEPTLLHDFLLGRPSPQRVGQKRAGIQQQQRRKSVGVDAAAVREELKQEFRAAAVRKLQQPGGVRDRVKQWQKTNAAALKSGVAFNPEVVDDVASEPTEILVNLEDKESVTEEDRVRLKMRQKPKKRRPRPQAQTEQAQPKTDGEDGEDGDEDHEQGGVVIHQDDHPINGRPRPLPKKRIVSDSHWMKQGKGRSPPRGKSPKVKEESSPVPIPKDFLLKTARNPPVRDKIKDWAKRVETPEPPPPQIKKYKTKTGDTITIEEEVPTGSRPTSKPHKERSATDDDIDGMPARSQQSKSERSENDDGIRIKPVRVKRVKVGQSNRADDGIRIRPGPETENAANEIIVIAESSRAPSKERSTRAPSRGSGRSRTEKSDTTEPAQGHETPNRRKPSPRRRPRRRPSPPTTATQTQTDDSTDVKSHKEKSGSESDHDNSSSETEQPSELPAMAPGSKPLADIPVGFSAFSELDLPLGADARNRAKRPKQERTGSFKAVPKVLKKVVTEGKKILQDKVVDPPKPVINQPPSIETWLNTTVDPFVDEPKPKEKVEKDWVKETRRRSTSDHRAAESQPEGTKRSKSTERQESQQEVEPTKDVDPDVTPKQPKIPASGSAGLKRKGATRATASPLKPAARKPFKEQLKDAFRGESGGHKLLPVVVYPSCEVDEESYVDHDESDSELRRSRRSSSGSSKRSRSRSPTDYTTTVDSSSSIGPLPADTGLPRRRPPTNGYHELSTIASEVSCSTYQSDTISTVSQSTITQETSTFTRSTDPSRGSRRSQKPSGLKRRLTKHSDLVSVLSLPDNSRLRAPSRTRSVRSGGRLLRKTSKLLDSTSVDDLLEEFADDEYYYLRELKTLVDGVVPVLLTQFVDSTNHSSKDLFGSSGKPAENLMAKAVVEMGIALEKMKDSHRRVPVCDIHAVLLWLDSVYPIYDKYLDVWRLGFQDLIVNLAPAAGKSAEEDSLVNAMPRNEDGDVLDESGEPVDVAHLLRRPLIRIKWMVKLIKGTQKSIKSQDLDMLLERFEKLQEKARRRHREETARKEDEDANNTDVTRTRDLRSLAAIDHVVIDQSRQVNAKDVFSLDLKHSSNQRLECRVEIIYRDNLKAPLDKGDILVRETGASGRSWLLFPPIPKAQISACRGEGHGELTVMVRGFHNYREWYELLTLITDDENQVADWLEIFGSDPMPLTLRDHIDGRERGAASSPPRGAETDIPVGARKLQNQPPSEASGHKTPSRYHKRNPTVVITPPNATPAASPDRTPTQGSFPGLSQQYGLPPHYMGETKATKAPPNSTPFRDDGAPPPPIHRTLGPKSTPSLSPPVDIGRPSALKRRGSSPLKHECHPSDISSASSATTTDESDLSGSESSSDEFDDSDVPDTLPAISIKGKKVAGPGDSVISDDSLSPSNSASQAEQSGVDFSIKALASISYWSNKLGTWKDVSTEACSIVITPGLIEAFALVGPHHTQDDGTERPLIALDLTPVVLVRTSNSVDIEIRSPVRSYSVLNKIDGAYFRFRSMTIIESAALYEAVHRGRMNNAKFKAIEEEARFRSFGQQQINLAGENSRSGSGSTSSRRRTWFGRKNSYRASARAPSESQGSFSSGISASSFLKRLTGGGNLSFNIDKSTVDKQSRPDSAGGNLSPPGPGSLYSSSASSSARGGPGLMRSPSVSIADTGMSKHKYLSPEDGIPIRLYSAVPNKKWEDFGNCRLQILRPPPGMHQELQIYHGMEKRIKVTQPSKKDGEDDLIIIDVVLGSGCFSKLGGKGVVVKVWEDIRDKFGNVGVAPASGGVSGKLKTWCFQTKTSAEAAWVGSFLTQEVELG